MKHTAYCRAVCSLTESSLYCGGGGRLVFYATPGSKSGGLHHRIAKQNNLELDCFVAQRWKVNV